MSGHSTRLSYQDAYVAMSEAVEDMFAAHGEQRAALRRLIRRASADYRAAARRENRQFFSRLWRHAAKDAA